MKNLVYLFICTITFIGCANDNGDESSRDEIVIISVSTIADKKISLNIDAEKYLVEWGDGNKYTGQGNEETEYVYSTSAQLSLKLYANNLSLLSISSLDGIDISSLTLENCNNLKSFHVSECLLTNTQINQLFAKLPEWNGAKVDAPIIYVEEEQECDETIAINRGWIVIRELVVKPRDIIKEDELFSTEQGFKEALVGCYIALAKSTLYGQQLSFTDLEYMAQHWEYNENQMTKATSLKLFNYNDLSVKASFTNIYAGLYNVISNVNQILNYIDAKGDAISAIAVRKVIQGEAYAIRAMCHLDILRLFGQMPKNPTEKISLPYNDVVTLNIKYYTYNDFVAKIESDLIQAEALLKDNDPLFNYTFDQLDSQDVIDNTFFAYRQYRLNYWAVKGLMARLYLYTENSSKAYNAAISIINGKGADGNSLLTLGNFNKEWLMGLSINNFNDLTNIIWQGSSQAYNQVWLSESKLNRLFSGNHTDRRYSEMWGLESVNQGQAAAFKKYNYSSSFYQGIPIIRLSEIYLIAIESASTMNEANRLYKEYMQSKNILANDIDSKDSLQEALIDEYRREFWGEGQMFYTYKRLGAVSMLWREGTITESNYIIPLDLY